MDECAIAVCNSGAIKHNLKGKVQISDINLALPYKNQINKIQIKGSTLKEVFEHSAEQLGDGGFLQVCVHLKFMPTKEFYTTSKNNKISKF